MKRFISLLTAIIMALQIVAFADDDDIEYEPFIDGYENHTFVPEGQLARTEAVSIFSELIGKSEKTKAEFSDVDENAWYYGDLEVLMNNGYLRSYGDKFYPDESITRLDFCEFLYMYKYGSDTELSKLDMFMALIQDGTVKGYDDGSYGEGNTLTRAEAVALINRSMGIKANAGSIAGLNKTAFSDVDNTHWAFYDIILAAKGSREFRSYPREIPDDYYTKEFDKYNEKQNEWQVIAMINDNLREKGVEIGGEGAQRMNALAISSDGTFLLVGNDVASIHRSIDGGKTWEMCNRGFYAKSGEVFAIDPNNNDRVIGYGGNHTLVHESNGLYLSKDRGFSWKQTLIQKYNAPQLELRESISYDQSSFSEEIGGSSIAYWSKDYWLKAPSGVYEKEEDIPKSDDPAEKKGLFKTEDGGETWFVVNEDMSDSIIKVHPKTGVVYASNLNGFFRSEDGGKTFQHILSGSVIYGMDVIDTYPDNVYLNDYKGVLVSTDSGKTFTRVKTDTFPKAVDINNPYKQPNNLKVSPLNPDNMVIAYGEGFGAYKCAKYYSKDGGKTWTVSNEKADKDFFLKNNREAAFVWSPTVEDKVWAFGGDWVVSSEDGGTNYYWDYEGGAAVFVDGRSVFNLYDPDLFYYGSQDFHGAFTKDGGKNWKHIWKVVNAQGAGFVYGAYAADENTLIALASSYKAMNGIGSAGGWGGVSEIRVSRDGGETWTYTGVYILDNHRKKWAEMCYQSPRDPNVLFAANYRSEDYGYTWTKMPVDLVYTHNPYGDKELYGAYDNHIMVSYDDGATWKNYAEAKVPEALVDRPQETEIWDMSYDGVNNIMYYISGTGGSGQHFMKIQNGEQTELTDRLNKDKYGVSFQLCAVDPRYTQVVYVGGYGGNLNGPSIQRSVDMCESFQVIGTVADDLSIVKTGPAGGVQPYDLIVHPITGELWVTNGCAGWAKIAPPYEN